MPTRSSFSGLAKLIEAFDWSQTPSGPKTMLNVCLSSPFQLAIYWARIIFFDAEREVIGSLPVT
jgi:hypothetical protein